MKKQILISIYDMEIGGIERSLINMLESFDYAKYDVDLLICRHTGDFMSLIPPQVRVLPEMPRYTVFRKSIAQCVRGGHVDAAAIRLLAKALAWWQARRRRLKEGSGYIQMQLASRYSTLLLPAIRKTYDLAISYAWPHDLTGRNVKASKKIAWVHTDFSELEIDNRLDLKMWSRFDHIAAVSDACARAFLKTYPALRPKLFVLENITSPAFIHKMAEDPIPRSGNGNGASSGFTILSVGRLSYVKGFDLAVQALRRLHDRGLTDIRWMIVGYGGYEGELRHLVEQHGLTDSFLLMGKQPNPYPYMKACDLYVQPSRYEGKAVTVTEAKILARPVLITNYPTSSSQVEDGVDGIICELSPEGIADAIERLYRDAELRASLTGWLREQNFSNRHELEKLEMLADA